MSKDLPEGFGSTPFLKFYHGDWQKLLKRVEIPAEALGAIEPDPSWDRKAAWLLYRYGVEQLTETEEGEIFPGWNEILDNPIPGPLGRTIHPDQTSPMTVGPEQFFEEPLTKIVAAPVAEDKGVVFSFDARPAPVGIDPLTPAPTPFGWGHSSTPAPVDPNPWKIK